MMTAVDRTVPLSTTEYGRRNPDRVHVVRGITLPSLTPARPWQVWRGPDPLDYFATHAEAVRWAQANATLAAAIGIQVRINALLEALDRATRYDLPEPMETP